MRNIFKLRFSLATLLVVVTALSIWFAKITNDAREQAAAIKGVQAKEGIVQFDTLAVPDWLKKAIGEEYFRDEKSVCFATNRGRTRATNEPKATAATLEYLASLTNIETLELGNNREVTDSSLVLLTSLKNLTTLYLYRTGIRGPGLVHVAKLPKLSAISLSDTDHDDSGAKHLGRMSRLAWARLDNTRLTDAGLSELAQATALKTLTLRNTEITDRGLVYLEQLKQLEVLNLAGTRVTVAGVAHLKQAIPKGRNRSRTRPRGIEYPPHAAIIQERGWIVSRYG